MRKKRENGMAKESGMGDFPRKQFESVLLHSLRIMDQNREYLQMHLARTGDERTRQALEDMGQESIRLERTLREIMGLLEVEMNDKPPMKPVDLCWILMEAAQIAPEIEKQLGIRLIVDHSPFRRCYVKADAQEAEQLLFHLLSNALRAVSPGGQIKIRRSPLPTACAGRSCGSLPCCPIKWNDMIFSALLRAFPGQGVFA